MNDPIYGTGIFNIDEIKLYEGKLVAHPRLTTPEIGSDMYPELFEYSY